MQRKATSSMSSSAFIKKSFGATQVLDDSLESTERSLAMLDSMERVGGETRDTLYHQGDQLRRIQGDMDEVVVKEKKAKRLLSSISSIWGTLVNYFKSEPTKKDTIAETDKIIKKQKRKKKKKEKEKPVYNMPREEEIVDLSVLSKANQKKNEKVNDNIEEISKKVSAVKIIAEDMGEELDRHNIRIDKINETTHGASETMKGLQGRMGRM